MKIKLLYLAWIVTMLLSACSFGGAVPAQPVKPPKAQATAVSAQATPAVKVVVVTATQVADTAPSATQVADLAPTVESRPDPGQQQPGGPPPQAAIDACAAKSEQETCEFTSDKGTETGVCEMVQQQLACSPKRGPADKEQPGNQDQNNNNGNKDQNNNNGNKDQNNNNGNKDQKDNNGNKDQPGEQKPGTDGSAYNIEQAISDKAQGMTISYDALAFITGDLGSDSFFPPGKVADFWGFQYLRDNDPSQMGHAGDFLTSAAMNMLNVLTADQRAELVTLAKSQVGSISQYGYRRFVLMDAFRRLLEGKLPTGTTGLDEVDINAYSGSLYRLDGEISYARAQVMGTLLSSLDASQLAYLDGMVGKGMLEWPDVQEPADIQGLDRAVKVAVMTYAADMYSWYAGSVAADVYFCPERHGTYFGSFYLKDIPAMGNPEYAIPTDLTGNLGDAMLSALTPDQAQLITGLVDIQRPYLTNIVSIREQLSTELRKFKEGGTADRAVVLDLMQKYGELDGSIIYNLAGNFTRVNQTLSSDQKAQLMAMRQELLGNLIYPTGAYLYSEPIAMPEIPNTDFMFK